MADSDTNKSKVPARPPLTVTQVLVILAVIAGLLIMLDFNRRQAEAQRLEADRNQLGTQVAMLEAEHSALETQVAFATTDALVIEWAHEQGKLAQDGEVLVVPVLPTPQPTPQPAPPQAPPAPPGWVVWWTMFFDVAPPALP